MTQAELQSRFPQMTPVKSPPALFRVNGCGVSLYGKRDEDPQTGSHVATWCLSLLFVPVLGLRAYRVARAPGRAWYFLGREPLSALVKWWNASVIAGVLATIAVAQCESFTSRPQYQAKKQMAHAAELVKEGHLAQGASEFKVLVLHHSVATDQAVAAAEDLLKNKIDQAPLPEALGVLTAAAAIGHQGFPIPLSEVAQKGMQIVAARGDAEPAAALQILDAIRPLQSDPRALDDRRLLLLKSWASSEPQNLDAVAPLAMILSENGDSAGARKLLMHVKDKLADGEGARVLGLILAREGDYDGSYQLLWPYVKTRLDGLHQAEHVFEATYKSLSDHQVQILKGGQAPDDFYTKYKVASENEKQSMVTEYVNQRVKDDPAYTSSQAELAKQAAVVPVAMELGIVMLNQAQGEPDTERRKSELQSAEQVFLAIGGVASESDTYRLSLGQVYYWLGKQDEGRKLFDEFLRSHNGDFHAMLQLAAQYRQIGSELEARTMGESAYAKSTTDAERYSAANFRARCYKDLDDEIAWLQKTDPAEPNNKASLFLAMGDKALMDGRDQESAASFKSALDVYATMPRSDMTINESALAYYGIFEATGDRASLDRCIDFFQQAVDLNPTDTVLIYNAASTILVGAVADVIGSSIDLRALHSPGELSTLSYLYNDQSGRQALVLKLQSHPGVQRALSYLQKLMVISPKKIETYESAYAVHSFTRDEAALGALNERVKSAGLDVSDQLAQITSMLSGEKDQEHVTQLTARLARARSTLAAVRSRNDRTAAVAMDTVVLDMLSLDSINGQQSADEAVDLAKEAYRVAPSAQAQGMVEAALLNRAGKNLRKSDAGFDAFAGKFARETGPSYLIAVAASEATPYQHAVLGDPDVQAATQIAIDQFVAYPDSSCASDWAVLNASHPREAARSAGILRGAARYRLEDSIESTVSPCSITAALNSYWMAQIDRRPDDAKAALQRIAAFGLPVPIQP